MFSNFPDLFISFLFLGPTNVSVQIAMIALGPISEKEQVVNAGYINKWAIYPLGYMNT